MIHPNKTRLTDLNIDCIFLILEQLKFNELINVAKTNRNFAMAAAYTFNLKYSKHRIVIETIFKYPTESNPFTDALKLFGFNRGRDGEQNSHQYYENDELINLGDHRLITDAFKLFDILNLEIKYSNSHTAQAILLGELISTYGSESLQTVRFNWVSENALQFITKPLINAKSVSFRSLISNTVHGVIPMNELFPSVENLYVNWFFDEEYLHSYMPNLKHLYIFSDATAEGPDPDTLLAYGGILRKNPQIISIEVYYSRTRTFELIKSLLPNLQILAIWEYLNEPNHIQFDSVTTFKVKFASSSPSNLHFSNLECLYINLESTSQLGAWLNFLQEHNHITEFHIIYSSHTAEHLEQLLSRIPNLMRLQIFLKRGIIGIEFINNLTENHPNLHQLHLSFDDENDKELYRLNLGRIQRNWFIVDIDNGFSFEC